MYWLLRKRSAHFFTHCETLKFFRVKILSIWGSYENWGNFALVNYKSLWKCGTEGCRKPSRKYNLQFFTNSSCLIQNYTKISQKRWNKFISYIFFHSGHLYYYIIDTFCYSQLASCNGRDGWKVYLDRVKVDSYC